MVQIMAQWNRIPVPDNNWLELAEDNHNVSIFQVITCTGQLQEELKSLQPNSSRTFLIKCINKKIRNTKSMYR